jgi:hypothetical protein
MAGTSRWQDGRRAWVRLYGYHQRAIPASRDSGEAAVRGLEDVRLVRGLLDTAELNAVSTARRHGVSWSSIAVAVGVTRQAAWEKWHDQEDSDRQEGAGSHLATRFQLSIEEAEGTPGRD